MKEASPTIQEREKGRVALPDVGPFQSLLRLVSTLKQVHGHRRPEPRGRQAGLHGRLGLCLTWFTCFKWDARAINDCPSSWEERSHLVL